MTEDLSDSGIVELSHCRIDGWVLSTNGPLPAKKIPTMVRFKQFLRAEDGADSTT